MGEKVVKRTLADGTVKEYRYARRGKRVLSGSVGALIQEYRQSPNFKSKAENTKKIYLRAMGHMEPLYRSAITDIKRRHIIKLRDQFQDTPALANQIVNVFSVLMTYAVGMEYRETTPARKIEMLPVGEYQRWPEEAIDFALATFPERFRRAILLALYTGQREGDICNMSWADYDGEGIQVAQEKTDEKLWIACHSALKAELDQWKKNRTSTRIITNTLGQPYRSDSFATRFSAEMRKHVELHGLVFHGLRKNAAAQLAEVGCSPHEIAAVTGHRSLAMIMHYTKAAEQKGRSRAAIRKLENAQRKTPGDNQKETPS